MAVRGLLLAEGAAGGKPVGGTSKTPAAEGRGWMGLGPRRGRPEGGQGSWEQAMPLGEAGQGQGFLPIFTGSLRVQAEKERSLRVRRAVRG